MDNIWYEKIEDYINGVMNTEERVLFEAELERKEELNSIFNLYTEIETQMRNKAQQKKEVALKKTLNALNDTYFFNKEVLNEPQHLLVENIKAKGNKHLSVSHQGFLQAQSKRNASSFLWVRIVAVAAFIGFVVFGAFMFFLNIADHSKISIVNKNQVPTIIDANVIKDTTLTSGTATTSVEVKTKTLPSKSEGLTAATKGKKGNALTKKTIAKRLDIKEVEALFSQYFTADLAPANLPEYLEEPFDDFENKRYDVAITKYHDILAIVENEEFKTRGQQNVNEVDATFYMHYFLGQSYLAVDSTAKAIVELQKAVNINTSSINKDKARWFLALSFLKTNQLKKAIPLLKNIANNKAQNYYQQSAQALLKNL